MSLVMCRCYIILYKGLEHLWILVFVRILEPVPLRIPRETLCVCVFTYLSLDDINVQEFTLFWKPALRVSHEFWPVILSLWFLLWDKTYSRRHFRILSLLSNFCYSFLILLYPVVYTKHVLLLWLHRDLVHCLVHE